MRVTVRLYATLRQPAPDGLRNRLEVELPAGATVVDLLREIGLPVDPDHVMALIDTRRVEPHHPLRSGDEVKLFPPISGG
jgi:molybdopterin converting factor small subunit